MTYVSINLYKLLLTVKGNLLLHQNSGSGRQEGPRKAGRHASGAEPLVWRGESGIFTAEWRSMHAIDRLISHQESRGKPRPARVLREHGVNAAQFPVTGL